jgi:uncharacterized protein with gpF-like domain
MTDPQDDLLVVPVLTKKRKTAPIVLSLVAVPLVGASILLAVLISNETTQINALTTQLADKQQDLAESVDKEHDNTAKLAKSQEDKKKAEDAQKTAEVDSAPLATCHEAARTVRKAAIAQDIATGTEAMKTLFSVC